MVKQPSIFFKINQEYKDFDSRYLRIHKLRDIIENLLKSGYTPIDERFEKAMKIKITLLIQLLILL